MLSFVVLMFTPSFSVFFCMFSRLDCNREEENEVSKMNSFLMALLKQTLAQRSSELGIS